jgi:hypothetical protein
MPRLNAWSRLSVKAVLWALPRFLRTKMSGLDSKAGRILSRIQANVGGELLISMRGVPHLVIGGVGGLSIAYFGKRRFVRIFTGYRSSTVPQERFDFKQWPDAKAFLQARLGTSPATLS